MSKDSQGRHQYVLKVCVYIFCKSILSSILAFEKLAFTYLRGTDYILAVIIHGIAHRKIAFSRHDALTSDCLYIRNRILEHGRSDWIYIAHYLCRR